MVLGSSPVAVTSPSDFAPASSKEFLDIQATIECGFTLKCIRDMTRTYALFTCSLVENLNFYVYIHSSPSENGRMPCSNLPGISTSVNLHIDKGTQVTKTTKT